MAQTVQIKLDDREFNAAVQGLKVAIEQFVGAKIYLVQENGNILAATSMQRLAKENPTVANILKHLVLLAGDFGGELQFTPDEESVSMTQLGFCGVQEPYGHTVCSFDIEHEGPHSWL